MTILFVSLDLIFRRRALALSYHFWTLDLLFFAGTTAILLPLASLATEGGYELPDGLPDGLAGLFACFRFASALRHFS